MEQPKFKFYQKVVSKRSLPHVEIVITGIKVGPFENIYVYSGVDTNEMTYSEIPESLIEACPIKTKFQTGQIVTFMPFHCGHSGKVVTTVKAISIHPLNGETLYSSGEEWYPESSVLEYSMDMYGEEKRKEVKTYKLYAYMAGLEVKFQTLEIPPKINGIMAKRVPAFDIHYTEEESTGNDAVS
jgi:hypothetical protein